MSAYPGTRSERDQWIEHLRPPREPVNVTRPHAFLLEKERQASGAIVDSLCVFLTNRECPWRCVMCDLWKHTTTAPTPVGAIPAQINHVFEHVAVEDVSTIDQIKLYNSGSFFDAAAVPRQDWGPIANQLRNFRRVIVESHPLLVNDQVLHFRDTLSGQLEVAMGLETIHPEVWPKLNKGMTPDQFAQAAQFLTRNQIDVRAFILIQPPWLTEPRSAIEWSRRSAAFAFDCGASVVSLIPTRAGNGAMEALAEQQLFAPPTLSTIEAAIDATLALKRGRVFCDLWNLQQFASCPYCLAQRIHRLNEINEQQQELSRLNPTCCAFP